MANVTYLLGAGASANCLPTYLNFFKRFEEFKSVFEANYSRDRLPEEKFKDFENIRNIVRIIAEEFRFHNTPDTIAKKYFHSRSDDELKNLKNILLLFFLYEQTYCNAFPDLKPGDAGFKQPVDKRYDSFIAALLKPLRGRLLLCNQFKILTWNYDLQFEIAYSKYASKNVPYCQKIMQSIPYIFPDGDERFDLNKFGIVHLNGIAYAKADSFNGNKDFMGGFLSNRDEVLLYLIDVYHSICSIGINQKIGGNKLLSFAWEKQNEDETIFENEILQNAVQVAEQTQTLVIVGYSFPIFNNPIDKYILGKMNQLRKVYIQSPNGNEIKEMILPDLLNHTRLKKDDIINTGYWSQFHIPSEWNKDFGTLA